MNIKFVKHICASLLITSFLLVPVSQNLSLQRAEAQWAVTDAGNIIQNTLSAIQNTLSAISLDSIWVKEYTLDGIAWMIINKVLEKAVESTTEWVNNGFKNPDGSSGPAFISNFEDFLIGVADQAVGEFLFSSGPLESLCSPFKLNITSVLGLQYSQTGRGYKPVCSLSDAIDNLEGLLDGDFLEGGFDDFAKMALTPTGNPYGSTFSAQAAMQVSITNSKSRESQQINWGAGFKTQKKCDPPDADGRERCWDVTPGNVIENGLNNTLNLGNERLTVGDEIDELVAALLSQLMTSILGEGGNLKDYKPPEDNSYDPDSAAAMAANEEIRRQVSVDRENASSTNSGGETTNNTPGNPGDWCFIGGDSGQSQLICSVSYFGCTSLVEATQCFQIPETGADQAEVAACIANCYAINNCPQNSALCPQIADVNTCIASSCQ